MALNDSFEQVSREIVKDSSAASLNLLFFRSKASSRLETLRSGTITLKFMTKTFFDLAVLIAL
jgi:hypothetical protein